MAHESPDYKRGVVDRTLQQHGDQLKAINGHIGDMASAVQSLTTAVDLMRADIEARDTSAMLTATALKDASAKRWTISQKVIVAGSSLFGIVSTVKGWR